MPHDLDLTVLDQRLQGMESVAATIQEKVFAINSLVTDLQASVGKNQRAIESVEAKVDGNDTTIRTIEEKVGTSETTLADVKTNVDRIPIQQLKEGFGKLKNDMVQREVVLMRWLVGLLFSALVSVALTYALSS